MHLIIVQILLRIHNFIEIWDVMIRTGNGFDYFEDDTVIAGGISGVYGEGGWFVPKYVYDDHPEWILPQQLKYNETLRQIFIDAYTIHSDTNWVDEWWNIWQNDLNEYSQYGFGFPNGSIPIIFGSYQGYAISEYSGKLVNNVLDDGLNWTFAALKSEGALTDFVVDLYSKRLPFIANLYSPHLDFAMKLENMTGYMQFERVALPRNPNNDVQDTCYLEGQCTFPLSPLLKIGNPKMQKEFPEMFAFLLDFQMTTNDVNDIIAYHQESSEMYLNLTEHELWINATCKWLKQTEETTDEWHQDINRYDCIFDQDNNENNHCGFNYYYKSFQDAQNDENVLNIEWYNSIAGKCSNDSDQALCNCSNEYFIGDTCRSSCPGIIGPIEDKDHFENHVFVNSSKIVVGNYTFYVCNGNGECNIDHKRCDCELGYGGDDCSIVYQVFKYDTGLIVLWSVLFIICIIILILSILWVYQNRHYKTIKALSPNLTILFTIGLILLCIGTIVYLFHPLNDVLCNSRAYFYGIGAILTIMAPLCKTYRVAIIFAQARNLKKIEIPDKKLLVYLVNAVGIETVICIIYTVLHQIYGGVEKIYLEDFQRIQYVCNQSAGVRYIESANYLYIFTLIMVLCFFSYKNRATHKVFKESRCAYFGSFFSLFVFLVVVIFNLVVIDISIIITIQSGAMLIALCVVWALFYGIRIWNFFKYPEERSTVHVTSTNSMRQSNGDKTDYDVPKAKGHTEMPSYVNELYKQRGFESTTQGPVATLSFNDVSEQATPTPLANEIGIKDKPKYEHTYSKSGGRSSSNYKDDKQRNGEEDDDDDQGIDESDNLIDNK